MRFLTACVLPAALLLSWGFCQAAPPGERAAAEADRLEPEIRRLSLELWNYSETALREHRSAALLAEFLEKEGFEVRRNVGGMPTAFVASFGTGRPIVGVLAEYDALPSVGNQAIPRQEPRKDGVTAGHGCGHNLFGAASVCGAIALKRTMAAEGLPGSVRLYGCPAEETLIGKVFMAKAGLFDDLDVVIDWHPSSQTAVRNNAGLAMNSFTVEYFGRSAHGAVNPWDGRSALDAVELMNYGVNLLREHVRPTTRIHYVIPEGGKAPNVVPNYARVWYYVRGVDRDSVAGIYGRVLKIARGAATATETTHKVTLIAGCHESLLNRALQERGQKVLEEVGCPQHSDQEQQFGRALQRALGVEEKGFLDQITPLPDNPELPFGGSTDSAEVSWIAPTVAFRVATIPPGTPAHSWAATACCGSDAGIRGAATAAKVIAVMGVELLTDAKLREKAQAEFVEQTGGKPYESPVPDGQRVQLPESD